jgi:integrase
MTDDNNALVPLRHDVGEIALPDQLVEQAQEYMAKSKAEATRIAYAYWTSVFEAWCKRHRCKSLPASEETVAAWITDLAKNGSGDRRTKTGKAIPSKPLSRSSINQALAALQAMHIDEGCSLSRKHRVLGRVLAGINRDKVEVERQAAPILADDVRDLLSTVLNVDCLLDCRNAAMVTVGWGAALRRSELIGLDWQELGTGTGWATVDERGILLTIARSKASQDKPETVVIPRADLPEACDALQAWIERVGIKPGEPIFRGRASGETIAAKRLRGESVDRTVKKLMRHLFRARGKSKAEAKELAKRYSGHSLRAGYATSAAAADVPQLRIQQQTRHRSSDMVARYVREQDKWSKSGLKGVLHKGATHEERSALEQHLAKANKAERTRILAEFEAFLAAKTTSPKKDET